MIARPQLHRNRIALLLQAGDNVDTEAIVIVARPHGMLNRHDDLVPINAPVRHCLYVCPLVLPAPAIESLPTDKCRSILDLPLEGENDFLCASVLGRYSRALEAH